ncbi:hypothetical protein AVEN_50558-1 [Araneus ventricosus]|uniref:Uncharacterized protein n=1 Tax=Araneus ventricosus TaxID=182803 RepID=A0A4Y2AQI7_ARAVE|nr:hypothetical protein AVEN_50558-1 [Araneus ventricosus]
MQSETFQTYTKIGVTTGENNSRMVSVVHSLTLSADDLKKYYTCWEYGECQDETSKKNLEGCIEKLNPKEFQSYFQFLSNNYYSFNSDSLDGKIKEYCTYDNDKKQDVFDKIMDADFGFLKKASDEGNEGTQSRITQTILCVYNVFQNLQSEGKCHKES